MLRFFVLFVFLFNTLSAEQEQFGFIGLVGSYESVSFISEADLSNEKETTLGLRFGGQTGEPRVAPVPLALDQKEEKRYQKLA